MTEQPDDALLPLPAVSARPRPITDTVFGDYVALAPAAKRRTATAIRLGKRLGGGGNPYQKIVLAISEALAGAEFESCAARAIAATKEADQNRCRDVARRFGAYLRRHPGVSAVVVKPTLLWSAHGLRVKVAPHYVVRQCDGRLDALRLWMRESAPPPTTVRAELGLLSATVPKYWPAARPMLVDLRQEDSEQCDLDLPLAETLGWLAREAAEFVEFWKG
jgi:hypothetical protein